MEVNVNAKYTIELEIDDMKLHDLLIDIDESLRNDENLNDLVEFKVQLANALKRCKENQFT